jgi:hypothetical protein
VIPSENANTVVHSNLTRVFPPHLYLGLVCSLDESCLLERGRSGTVKLFGVNTKMLNTLVVGRYIRLSEKDRW